LFPAWKMSARSRSSAQEDDEEFKDQVEDLYNEEVVEAIKEEKEQEQVSPKGNEKIHGVYGNVQEKTDTGGKIRVKSKRPRNFNRINREG